jgi:hypothetical protein
MTSWTIFVIGSLLLTLVIVGGLLLQRQKQLPVPEPKKPVGDARILYLLLWLASLSILGYIAFTFGKR